jgi:inosine-uridine nucleoside N-ribohydrolase
MATARTAAWYTERLAPPRPGSRPRVVIDTDAANEIDDQYALAWALLSPERLDVRAVYAAPFSFAHRLDEMRRARAARAAPERAAPFDLALLRQHGARLARYEQRHGSLDAIAGWPVFCSPAQGMARSFDEIVRVFSLLRVPHDGRVFQGCERYLAPTGEPALSDAVEHLIALAKATPADAEPLYVVAIGCITNVASALIAAPEIAERIVVVWTSGYPSHAPHINFSLNLEQDQVATRIVLDSSVPLVYLPGFHVGAQLRLSLPEIERHVRPSGAIGAYLHHLYTHNPLADLAGIDDVRTPGFSWVIWDLINIAWLLNPEWVPSELVPTPALDEERRWVPRAPGATWPMREAHAVARDAIFADLFSALARAPG